MSTWLTSRRAFESLFRAAPNGIVALDADASILDCNPAWSVITGYARAVPNGLAPVVAESLEAASRGVSLQRTAEIHTASGAHMVLNARSIPVDDPDEPVRCFLVVQDVTYLHDADQRLRSLFDLNPVPAAIYDREGRVVEVNASAVGLCGESRAQIIGRALQDFSHPDQTPMVMEAFRQALDGKIGHCTLTVRTAAGDSTDYDATFIPRSAGAEISGAYGMFQSFTPASDAHREASQLAQAREQFELLFQHNPSVVLAIDRAYRITEINPAGTRISGYTREQILTQDVGDFVPPSQRDRVRAAIDRALAGNTETLQVDAYAADGRLVQYEATVIPIVANAAIVGVYGLLENVTERMRAERTVAAQLEEILDLEHDFRSLFDRNPDGIVLLSTEGTIVDANAAILDAAGRSRDQVLGQSFRGFLQGPELGRGWSFFRRAVDGESVHFEISSTRGNGSELPLEVTLTPKYAQGLVVGVYALMRDIADRKQAQRRLEMQSQRIRDLYLLATTPEHTEAHVMTTLQTGCRLLGMESGAIVDMSDAPRVEVRYDALELFSGGDDAVIEVARLVSAAREPVVAGTRPDGAGGCTSWMGARLLAGGAVESVLLFFSHTARDGDFAEIDHDTLALMSSLVSSSLERRRTRKRLRKMAYYDSLTGLPNRLYFNERLQDALAERLDAGAADIAVLFFDLDRFKDINDTLGHAMGDRLLQIAAHRLNEAAGENNVVARMGGDEFIVLARDCRGPDDAREFAELLLRRIEEPYRLDGGFEQYVTSSAGVAMFPEAGRDAETLIKNADIAMYRAKDRGGNGAYFYRKSLEAPLRTRLAQEKALRRALERRQFVLHYQPIIDMGSGSVHAVEALVRWNDPRRGLVYPDDFIGSAEASGLIVNLGEWVVASGAAQMRQWQRELGDFTLAVNISARQFHQPDLCARLLHLLQDAGVPPEALELEITESMALSDVAHGLDALRQLKRTGIRIAVDDFGTGHSSLSYLRRFDVDQIKIDRSFVAGIGAERSDETIVKAIIAMGHSLGLTIVAEGVETREQYDFLRTHGCDRAQGYLIGRPLEARAVEALIRERGVHSAPG